MNQRANQKFKFYVLAGVAFSTFVYGLITLRSINLARTFPIDEGATQKVDISPIVAFPNLEFEQPVDLQASPDDTNRLFVLEQKGVIRVFDNSPEVKEAAVFLDIRPIVFSGHSEEGLLGMVFHPHYKENGYFYVYHTPNNPRRSIVARYQVSADNPNQADLQSRTVILEIPQPFGNHKGGQLRFGGDGYLYIALGDGGSGGDPLGNGQNRKVLLGKILRIDVDHPMKNINYGIPADNPFVGNRKNFREEIYAYGLRNPWRFSFDPVTGWLWAGDVGQDKPLEEVNLIQKGKNYGWNIMEGTSCFKPRIGCNRNGIELPLWEYTNDQGRSITGGFVYRGRQNPALYGKYIYADFMSGRIWALFYDGATKAQNGLIHHDPDLYISSFGIDQNQELYFCSFNGKIYKFRSQVIAQTQNKP